MKIAVVSTNDFSGGAARAAYRLHEGFRLIGEDSIIISKNRTSADVNSIQINSADTASSEHIKDIRFEDIQYYINHSRTSLSNTIYSYPYPGINITDHPFIQEADIINFHWVAYFQSPTSIGQLLDRGKKIVWTIHDEWAFSGGCHYSAGCENFQTDCGSCPQLETADSIIARTVLQDKIQIFQDRITVVGPSKWLAGQAKKSRLFKNSRVENVPYSLDTETFIPYSKAEMKRLWAIPEERFTFLFGAESATEKRKGFFKLVEALSFLRENSVWQKAVNEGRIHFLLFGPPAKELKELGIPYTTVGTIHDDQLLSKVYAAADLFVLPSLEDNMPYTMMESLSSGTPIAAFRAGGMIDIIKDGYNGYIAESADAKSLSEKIFRSYSFPEERIQFGKNGREDMAKNFHLKVQAERYRDIFNDIINKDVSKISKIEKSSNVLVGGSTEENWGKILNEVSGWGFRTLVPEIEALKKSKAELEIANSRLQAQLSQGLSISYLYCAENSKYDFLKFEKAEKQCSFDWSEFEISYSLEKWTGAISEFLWIPMWRSCCSVEIISAQIISSQGRKEEISECFGNCQRRNGNLFEFYNSHPMLTFRVSSDDSAAFHLKGRWKVIDSYLAFTEYEKIRKESVTVNNLIKKTLNRL